jgi:hypothetical protein
MKENSVDYPIQSRIRSYRRFLTLAGSLAGLVGLAIAAPTPASATTGTISVSGTVSCQSHPIEGVWVESGGGGSGWASWQPLDSRHTNIATYSAKIQNTTLPTNIRLSVGCGGSAADWWSDNETGSTSEAGGALTGSTTSLNAVCNEGTVKPAAGDNERCWYGYASAAAAWAISHLSGPGANHAIYGSDLVTDDSAYNSWYGMCLAFAGSAYLNAQQGQWPSPTVSGPTASATGMYNLYKADGLIHSASEVPPVGALVFYPGENHIGIAVGIDNQGNYDVISATETGTPWVQQQPYNSFNSPYAGWAYPSTAFR